MQYPNIMTCLQHPKIRMRSFIYLLLTTALLCTNASFAAAGKPKPDFSGTWARPLPPPDEGEGDEGDDAASASELLPTGGMPPLKEPYAQQFKDAMKQHADAAAQGVELVNSSTLCRPEGMPSMMEAVYDLEIVQTPKQVFVLAEYLSQIRRVYLNEKMPALDDISPSYNGHSVGNWEGNTLVIQTKGVREDVQLMGIPHSAEMQITERWRLVGPDQIEAKIRIDDPQYLTKPYEYTLDYNRDKGYRIVEYICDNNRNTVDSEGRVDLKIPTPDK